MQAEPIDVASALLDLETRRQDWRRSEEQRLTRRLLLAPIVEEVTPELVAAVARKAGEYYLLASPKLTEMELRVAAYGCALKVITSGEDTEGLHATTFRKTMRLLRELARNTNRSADEPTRKVCLGDPPSRPAARAACAAAKLYLVR